MNAQDCYIKLVGIGDKVIKPTVSAHRVWDKKLFLACKAKEYANHKNEDERRGVIEISSAEYQANK